MFLFSSRKRSVDAVQLQIRRLLDLTLERRFGDADSRRRSGRYERSLPVLLAPWQNGSPIADDAVFAITENISHSGVAVILTQPFRFPHLCLGISTPNDSEASLCFFLGDCKHQAPLGGGFWSLGIELTDCASESCPQKLISLKRLAEGLHPGAVEAVCV